MFLRSMSEEGYTVYPTAVDTATLTDLEMYLERLFISLIRVVMHITAFYNCLYALSLIIMNHCK